MNCKVTFVVPAYNVEKYLETCIKSVIKQKSDNWELVLVDDGSSDATPEICDQFAELDNRIKVIHQENAGSAVARNKGFDAATGDWIAFIDGDDWIERDYLEVLQPYMNQSIDFIMYSFYEIRGKEKIKKGETQHEVILLKDDFRLLMKDVIDTEKRMKEAAAGRSQFWTKLYRKQFLIENQIRSNAELRMSQDVMFNLCVYSHANKAVLIPRSLYNYRILGNSTCHRYSKEQVARILKTMNVMGDYITKEGLKEEYNLLYQKRILVSLVNSCILDFCHKDNPYNYRVRRKKFLKMCSDEPFCSVLTVPVIRSFSFQKQICMWLVKFKWFGLLNLILKMKAGRKK